MTETDDAVARWIDAMSAVLGLPLDDADRDAVGMNLKVAQRMAALLATAGLDERDEPLPVYRP